MAQSLQGMKAEVISTVSREAKVLKLTFLSFVAC